MNPACPACGTATTQVRLREVTCFECPNCKGHCIRGAELERFLDEREAPKRFFDLKNLAIGEPRTRRGLTCPDCRTRSYHVMRACFIETDVCDTCVGLYFDKGEADAYVLRTRASTQLLEHASNTIERIEEILEAIFDGLSKWNH